jgi:hypothetical protein
MIQQTVFPHQVAVRLTVGDLFEVSRYCRDIKTPFRVHGKIDYANPSKSKPVKLWFSKPEVAQYFSERFST